MRRFLSYAASVLLAASLAPASAHAEEHFTAFAVDLSDIGQGSNGQLEIDITRWSSEAERTRLVDALKTGGQDALLRELQKVVPPVGRIRAPGEIGWNLRYAQELPGVDGGRRIVIATDRPMGFREASQRPRSAEYPFTLIELRLDRDGLGEGRASIATRITFDEARNALELENYASEAVRLQSVTEVG